MSGRDDVFNSSAVVASSDGDNLREWVTTLANHGIEARPCADLHALELAFSGALVIDALLFDLPFDGHSDFNHLKQLLLSVQRRPGIVAIIPETLRDQLVNALEVGVDVTLSGPARTDEVLAAITRTLRRRPMETDSASAWVLDAVAWTVCPPGSDSAVPLTYKEREFLLRVGSQPGDPVSKEKFVDLFGTTPELFDPRRLEIMVRRLRNKVRTTTGLDLPVNTAHGIGYAFGGLIRLVETGHL